MKFRLLVTKSFHVDGQTDSSKDTHGELINGFGNFANTPEYKE